MTAISKIWAKFIDSRLHLALLLCGGLFCIQFMNTSLGFTIMCIVAENMTEALAYDENYGNQTFSIGDRYANDSQSNSMFQHIRANYTSYCGKVHWSAEVQGLILSAVNWGRLTTPFCGWLTDRLNPLYLMGGGMLAAAVSTGLLPIATTAAHAASFVLVILLRVVLGLADAFVNPSVNRFIINWFPKEKRTLALTVVTCGRQFAVLVVFPIAGVFCALKLWQVLFYCAAIITFAWCSVWALFVIFQLQICYKKSDVETAEKIINSTVCPRIPSQK